MKLTGAGRRTLAVLTAAGAAMLLCFALGRMGMKPLLAVSRTVPETVSVSEGTVDVNTAGLEELMTLPGIGEVRAQAILDYRAEHGPFRCPEDLIQVKGIGGGILSGILEQITTGGEGDAEDFSGG